MAKILERTRNMNALIKIKGWLCASVTLFCSAAYAGLYLCRIDSWGISHDALRCSPLTFYVGHGLIDCSAWCVIFLFFFTAASVQHTHTPHTCTHTRLNSKNQQNKITNINNQSTIYQSTNPEEKKLKHNNNKKQNNCSGTSEWEQSCGHWK